ncbi:MAG: TerB family tellurite resistance protein [Gemmatimonadales bacterium]
MYAILALGGFFENVFPPVPSDFLVAFAAFLAHRSPLTPTRVWLAVWSLNAVGAVLFYVVTRRWGPAFTESRLGRRLLPSSAIASLEQGYLRFGIWGIFLTRLLPGFRSVVAPFAGLVRLPAVPTLLTMIVASGLWYAGLTWVGYRVGGEWEAIATILSRINTTLLIVAAVVVALIVISVLRRRARRRDDRMWSAIETALGGDPEATDRARRDPQLAAVAGLLVEIARTDRSLDEAERAQIEEALRTKWDLPPADMGRRPGGATAEYQARVTAEWDRPLRLRLLRRLREIDWADRRLQQHEAKLMARASELLGLDPEDVGNAPPGGT